MTDKPTSPAQPEKNEASADMKKGTQPLNPGAGPRPQVKLDPEIQERLRQMMNNRKQAREESPAVDKPVPASPAGGPPDKTGAPQPPAARAPAKPDASGESGKSQAWPEPAKALGSSRPLEKLSAPSASGPSKPMDPASPPASSMETARLNRQPPESPAKEPPPASAKPVDPVLAARKKAEAQAAIRTTSATRNVPRGRVAQEVWRVLFQAMVGAQSKELGVEVKGLSVVGRTEPDGDTKADLDLTPFNAGSFGVSRQHIILFPTDEGPCVIDLNSTNGTWINGLYLEPGRKYRLRSGDRIELGSLKMLVRVVSPGEQQLPGAKSGAKDLKPGS